MSRHHHHLFPPQGGWEFKTTLHKSLPTTHKDFPLPSYHLHGHSHHPDTSFAHFPLTFQRAGSRTDAIQTLDTPDSRPSHREDPYPQPSPSPTRHCVPPRESNTPAFQRPSTFTSSPPPRHHRDNRRAVSHSTPPPAGRCEGSGCFAARGDRHHLEPPPPT